MKHIDLLVILDESKGISFYTSALLLRENTAVYYDSGALVIEKIENTEQGFRTSANSRAIEIYVNEPGIIEDLERMTALELIELLNN